MKVFLLFIVTFLTLSCQKQEKKQETSTAKNKVAAVTKNISPDEFQKFTQNSNNTLLDVRTAGEYKNGHIKNALLMNWFGDDFDSLAQKLDTNKTILVYCQVGGRSASAMQRLKKLGFSTVYNLNGGIAAWKAKGFLLKKE